VNGAQGHFRGISLLTVLQVVQLDRTTCTLVVENGGQRGRLHFVDGELVDAETGVLAGTAAAYEIVGWREGDVAIDRATNASRRRIGRPLTAILLDVSKMIDEGRLAPGNGAAAALGSAAGGEHPSNGGNMNRLQQLLDEFRDEVPEFVSTDVVNVESGLSIGGGSVDPNFDASVAAACSAEVVKSNRRSLELLGLGADSTEDILISTRKVYLLIRMLGAEYYHVLAVSRKGNLGLARAIMKKHEPRLLSAVGELA
jgi:predicted regulator of Ras-like GTPase activity (Roadblock/LC7/MglB family)